MTVEPAQNGAQPEEGRRAPARLIALNGPDKGSVYPLPADGEIALGRAETNDVIVTDSEVSRLHCLLIAHDGGYRLRDNGSTNGSFVNGERVSETSLGPGARIHVGRTTFALVLPDDTRPAPAVGLEPPAEKDTGRKPSAVWVPPEPAERRAPAARKRRLVLAGALVAALLLLAASAVLLWPRLGGLTGLVGGAQAPGGATRSIAVGSAPQGAEVFLDNRFIGMTPVEVEIEAGKRHALRVVRRGYLAWRSAVDDATSAELTAKLRPEPTATLLVSASKPDTRVHLDGYLVGTTAADRPLRIPGVKLGQHEVRFEKPGFLGCIERIEITERQVRAERPVLVHGRLKSRKEAALRDLAAKEPLSALRHTELAHHYMVTRQADKAMRAYKTALELVYDGKDSSGYRTRLSREIQDIMKGERSVFHYGTKDEMDDARKKLEDMFVSLLPRYPIAKSRLTQMIRFYTSAGRHDDVLRVYTKMLDARPDDLAMCYRVAQIYTARNNFDAAITILSQAANRLPQEWGIPYRLGLAYLQRARNTPSANDKRLAIAHLRSALQLCNSSMSRRTIQTYLREAENLRTE